MKNKLFLVLLCTISMMFAACTSSDNKQLGYQLDYMPCKTSQNADWSFVNANGAIFCEDMFEQQPSNVIDGIFSIKESNGSYTLYSFDKSKPKIITEDLMYVGTPRYGILPICRKGGKIEIIDTNGKLKFQLPSDIVSCSSAFYNGYLVVTDESGLEGLIDTNGKTILENQYNIIIPLNKDLIYTYTKNDGMCFVNSKGEKNLKWKDEDGEGFMLGSLALLTTCYLGIPSNTKMYFAVSSDNGNEERILIYNLNHELILKCPERVKTIIWFGDNSFIYKGEKWVGVMDYNGNRIINDKYVNITLFKGGYLAYTEKYVEFLNKKGERVQKLDDYESIINFIDFAPVGTNNHECYILNNKFKPQNKQEIYQISGNGEAFSSKIESDFLDVQHIVNTTMNILDGKIAELDMQIGKCIKDVPYLNRLTTDEDYEDYYLSLFSPTLSCHKITLEETKQYNMTLSVVFDRDVEKNVYKEVEVRKYNYYYDVYFYETENQFDHVEIDKDAKIKLFIVSIDLPSADKIRIVLEQLEKAIKSRHDGKIKFTAYQAEFEDVNVYIYYKDDPDFQDF